MLTFHACKHVWPCHGETSPGSLPPGEVAVLEQCSTSNATYPQLPGSPVLLSELAHRGPGQTKATSFVCMAGRVPGLGGGTLSSDVSCIIPSLNREDNKVSTGIPVSLEIHGVNLTSRNRQRVRAFP